LRCFEIFVVTIAIAVSAAQAQVPGGEKAVRESDCSGCHAADSKVVGPAYRAIAQRYRGQDGIVAKLAGRIRMGGSGQWGSDAMTPHPDLTDAQCREMVQWILSLRNPVAAKPKTESKLYNYPLKDGKTARLDFPLYVAGKGQRVTKNVFRGYELFNSYCYRCHGTDAAGSQLGPDLRHALAAGMTSQAFLAVAMTGRKDKGMPSWAGFLTKEELTQTYEYVKGRSLDLVPAGRPQSEIE
jgi:cytochrome c